MGVIRQVRICLLMIAFGMIITACGNQTIIGNSRPPLDVTPSKDEIVIWHTFGEYETQLFENILIPLFEEKYPRINVKSVRQPYKDELKPALISRASANKPPDIIRMDIVWIPSFAQLGLLHPVSEFDGFNELKDQFYEEPLQSNYYNGKYYGVPLNTNTKISIYNKELIESSGENSPPETMVELIEMVESNQFVIGVDSLSIWATMHYFYGLGGTLTDPSYSKATGYLDSEKSISAVTKLLSLYQKGNLSVTGSSSSLWHQVIDGSYFAIDDGPWFYSVNSEEQIDYINEVTVSAPFPISNGKRALLGGENLVISKATKHKEAAWTFVKWMTSIEPQTYLAQTGLIPSNKYVELSGFYDQYPYYQAYLDSLDDALLRPTVAQWWDVEEIYGKYFTLIFSEKISVEDGLAQAAKEIDQILKNEEGR
ncbi:extracellular solute-binding protein [Halalkalibacter kiskunsagensis]|uniref:Extracellular solute-binding protein n=1 Tax=Halalkalibacter kiskunsagensis TaxID=1548599 RepID=A0ABV6KC73_9BACI